MELSPQTSRVVADLSREKRSEFITKTYQHLLGAIAFFVFVSYVFQQTGIAQTMLRFAQGSWLLILGAFMVVGWLASRAAHSSESTSTQYLALGGFVAAQALIFSPLLLVAEYAAPGVIEHAALSTLVVFGALTAAVFITRQDFSFMRGILMFGGIAAIGLIVLATFTSLQLGGWFMIAMIAFACCAILYDTSNVLHHYPEDRYVGASLELFASVALLFWYLIQFFMMSDD